MQNTIRKWLNRPFKKAEKPDFTALLSRLETKDKELTHMIVAANSLTAPVNRVALAYKARGVRVKELEEMIVSKNAVIDEKLVVIAENEKIISLLKAVLEELVPEDAGGSMAGVTE